MPQPDRSPCPLSLSREVSNAVSSLLGAESTCVRALALNESGHPWTLWVTDDDSELTGALTPDQEVEQACNHSQRPGQMPAPTSDPRMWRPGTRRHRSPWQLASRGLIRAFNLSPQRVFCMEGATHCAAFAQTKSA